MVTLRSMCPLKKKKWLKFHDGQYQFKVPFMLYADFGSILKPLDERYRDRMNTMKTERKSKTSYTEKTNTHVPSGWCVHSTFAYEDVPDPLKMYWGKDCVEKFVEYIEEEVKRLYETFPRQPMTKLTDVLKREHETAEKCHVCLKEFNDPKNGKVRDHCHYTGLYQGAAHNNCNLKYRIPDHISIVFHNLSGYDAHLFIKELGRTFNKNDIGVIAENKEKYISFKVKINVKLAGVKYKDGTQVHKNNQLRFIDSCRLMASSLEKLTSNLWGTSGIHCDKCKGNMELIKISGDYIASFGCERCRTKKTKDLGEEVLKKNFKDTGRFWECDEKFRLMIRKGVYPYEYIDSWKRFEEISLPQKDAFCSRLNIKGISDQDYEHAQQVWNTMEKKTLGCYHDTYLKTDVLLLTDVFETFRNTCLKNYKLDPAHFYTAQGLAWQALLHAADSWKRYPWWDYPVS